MSAITSTITKRTTKLGRPTSFNAQTRRRLLRCIAIGVPLSHCPAACGVSLSGFHGYHPRFEEAIQRAIAKAIEKHLRLIITAAENGDSACSRWYLERCHPEHFSRNRLELTGANGAPLTAQVALYLPAKMDSETHPVPAIVTTNPLIENETV
jgi:hypothetical protein